MIWGAVWGLEIMRSSVAGSTSFVNRCANVRRSAGVWISTSSGSIHPEAWAMSKSAIGSGISLQGSPGMKGSQPRLLMQSGKSFGDQGNSRKLAEGVLDQEGISRFIFEGGKWVVVVGGSLRESR